MSNSNINWAAIDADPKFQALHRKKTVFLWSLMIFSTVYYFFSTLDFQFSSLRHRNGGTIEAGLVKTLLSAAASGVTPAILGRRAVPGR